MTEKHEKDVKGTQGHMEKVRLLFARSCEFIISVAWLEQLPDGDLPEVAFVGRSNVGKSSLINALTKKRDLARTSNTPGRTQQLNYFLIDKRLFLVDMPGYGYARAPKSVVATWTKLIRDYLRGRVQLKRLFLLVDARHGLKQSDYDLMKLLAEAAVSYRIVLTKIDKVSKVEVDAVQKEIAAVVKKAPAALPEIYLTSSKKKQGFEDIWEEIYSLI